MRLEKPLPPMPPPPPARQPVTAATLVHFAVYKPRGENDGTMLQMLLAAAAAANTTKDVKRFLVNERFGMV